MRFLASTLLFLVFAAFGIQLYRLNVERTKLERQLSGLTHAVERKEREQDSLRADLRYFAEDRNLFKEFRALFNYRAPGEKLMVIVSKKKTE